MKRIAFTLAAITVASVAVAPAYATADFDGLRRENLEKDALNFDELRRENLDKDAISPAKEVIFDELRREKLDKEADYREDARREFVKG